MDLEFPSYNCNKLKEKEKVKKHLGLDHQKHESLSKLQETLSIKHFL